MEDSWEHFASVVTGRHCKRAFLDRPVPRETLARVLTAAANAPSTRNNQPWRVAVVTGGARRALADRLRAELDRGTPARPDYPNRQPELDPASEERGRLAGAGLFAAMGITRHDAAARRAHLRANLDFHGAPTTLIFHLPAAAVSGAFLETGFFLQNVMLGLVANGLGSCPQYSIAGYPTVLREQLGLVGRLIVCGLAVGYPDPAEPVNGYVPERLSLAEYVQWHD